MALLALTLLGCRHPAPPVSSASPSAGAAVAAPSGVITGGVYTDNDVPLIVPLPPPWRGTPGASGATLRLTATHPESGIHVEFAAVPGGDTTPIGRPECEWRFVDTADYDYAALPRPLTVSTCRSDETPDTRVLGWAFIAAGYAWHVDATVPQGMLDIAPDLIEALAGRARFGSSP